MAKEKKDSADKTDKASAGTSGTDKPKQVGSVPESPRRPAHTIDLEAEEIGGNAPEDETAGDRGAENNGPESAGPDKKKGAKARKTAPGAATSKGAAKPPPQRTRPGELRGFVTHLAAGLMGGLIGVVGAGVGLDRMPFTAGGEPADAGGNRQVEAVKSQGDELAARIGALEKKLGAQGGVPSAMKDRTTELESGLSTLRDRVARAEDSLEASEGFPAEMKERVSKLESTLKTLGETAEQGGDVAGSAAVAGRIAELESRVENRMETLESQIQTASGNAATASSLAALKQEVDALKARQDEWASQTDKALAPLNERLAALETSIGKLAAEAETNSGSPAAALALAFPPLRDAAMRGTPFRKELDIVKRDAPTGLDLGTLEQYAASGVPSYRTLGRDFAAHAEAARAALPSRDESDTLVGQFLDNARSIVRVRRLDGGAGGAQAMLNGMEAKVDSGDIAGAAAEADSLPAPARSALAPWLEQVRARSAVDDALTRLSGQITDMMADGTTAAGKR